MSTIPPLPELSQEMLQKRLERERKARFEAEHLLEEKALELYDANKALKLEAEENGEMARQLRDSLKELKSAQSKLIQSSKMESLGTLAGGIAHEINTPIQYIAGNLDFLNEALEDLWSMIGLYEEIAAQAKQGCGLEGKLELLQQFRKETDWETLVEDLNEAIVQSRQGVDQVTSIVIAMKDFANPGTNTKEAVDINAVLESAKTITHNEWKYCAQLEMSLANNLPEIKGVPSELNQVFLNMIVNAAHAIEERHSNAEQGRIVIETRPSSRGGICIDVHDNGCGIPKKNRESVFDPFFTTKPVGRGSGQGLALTYDIICNKHGGNIDITSQEGEGTTFTIHLPESQS